MNRIKPLSQRDPAWARFKLGTGSSTIGGYGCAITVLAMYLNALDPLPKPLYDPLLLNTVFIYHGGYRDRNIVNWPRLPRILPQIVYKGRLDCPDTPAPIAKVDEWLSDTATPSPLIAYVNLSRKPKEFKQHFVLILKRQTAGEYLIADPWIGDFRMLCPTYGVNAKQAICGLIWIDRAA